MDPAFHGLRRVGQIYMRATDLGRATAFYRDTLSVPFLFEVPRMAFFDLAGVRLMLGEPEGDAFDHPGSILYFDVPDLKAAHAELVRRGVAFDSAPHLVADMGDRELWMAFFKDSEENQLALMSEIPKA
ncbi:MAG: VOC family protein [Gemmatimonadales bacterium]